MQKTKKNLTQLSQVKEGKKEVMMGSYDGELLWGVMIGSYDREL